MGTNERRPVILLVQPKRDDRDMYVEFLRHAGLTPIPVSRASEAVRVAPHADVIVTGVLLPGRVDGIEFVNQLKRSGRTSRIPVIVLTACAWKDERERALIAGCDVFLSKPCLPRVLAREIRRLLARDFPTPSLAPHAA